MQGQSLRFKMNHIGTVPKFKMLNLGTLKKYKNKLSPKVREGGVREWWVLSTILDRLAGARGNKIKANSVQLSWSWD